MTTSAGVIGGRGPTLGDLVAGLSVALVLMPQSLAYAELAGLNPRIGLFAAALPPLFAAAFVSCPWLQTGPVALTALLTFGALAPLAEPGSDEYLRLATQLAVIVGVTRGLLGLLRLGRISNVMSQPVVVGFTSAAGVVITASQLPKMFGSGAGSSDNVAIRAAEMLLEPGQWQLASVLVSLLSLAVVMLGRRLHPLFPGVLVAVVASTVWSAITGYDGPTVGELPGALPTLAVPNMTGFADMILPGVIIAFVGFAEPTSIARTLCAQERLDWSPSRELLGSCVANLTSAASGAFPVGGSFSRSFLNHVAGANTSWSGAVTGALVLLMLPAAPLLSDLPTATLGAIIVSAAYRLIKLLDLGRIARRTPAEGLVAFVTMAATLTSAPRVDRGILAGIVLSFVAVAVAAVIGRRTGTLRHSAPGHGGSGDHIVLAPHGSLWFLTSAGLLEQLSDVTSDFTPGKSSGSLTLDMAGVDHIDETAAAALSGALGDLIEAGTAVEVVGANRQVSSLLGDRDARLELAGAS